MLVRRGYDPDPVKAWKEAQNKLKVGTLVINISNILSLSLSLCVCVYVWFPLAVPGWF